MEPQSGDTCASPGREPGVLFEKGTSAVGATDAIDSVAPTGLDVPDDSFPGLTPGARGMSPLRGSLRNNRKGHLRRADVVRDVLRRHDEFVLAWRQVLRNPKLADVRTRLGIPGQSHRRDAIHPGHDRPRQFGGADLQTDGVSTPVVRP